MMVRLPGLQLAGGRCRLLSCTGPTSSHPADPTGFIWEHGPFTFKYDSDGNRISLSNNPASWHHAATMIYLDSPAGEAARLPAGATAALAGS